jgi:hypothetical protein
VEIKITNDDLKFRIARFGPRTLFGEIQERKNLTRQELILQFDKVWDGYLHDAITKAEPSQSSKSLLEMALTSNERSYFDATQEHRRFLASKGNIELIAQLKPDSENNSLHLTQLWFIPVRHKVEVNDLLIALSNKKNETRIWSEGYYRSSATYKRWYLLIGVPATVIAIFAGSSYIGEWFEPHGPGILSLLVGGLTALQTFLDLGSEREKRESAGKKWGKLSRQIEHRILQIDTTDLDLQTQIKILEEIIQNMNEIEDFSPALGHQEYQNAIKKLNPMQQDPINAQEKRNPGNSQSIMSIWQKFFPSRQT